MRNSLVIAFVSTAVYLKLDKKSGLVDDVRIAFNRVTGKIPERARRTEEALHGKLLTMKVLDETTSALRKELRLSSDFRVSEEYRSEVAGVLFKRALTRCYANLVGRDLG
jgi:carbon-monoxide dehydrogenase medium subunit